jgi:Flp pilus assembly protein TadG
LAEDGNAAVEFALLLPVLVLILLGTIDFGRFAYAAISITNAAQAGASACAYIPCESYAGSIPQVVINESAPNIDIQASSITVTQLGSGPGCTAERPCLRVDVEYDFSTLVDWPGIPSPFTIARSAQVVTALETPP